jgi:hypothetical protein
MNTMKNHLGLTCILALCCSAAFGQQTGAIVGAKPGSALHAQKAAPAAGPKLETSSLTITCDSVANVTVTDPRGRRLGDDPKAHAHYDEIPNAYYEGGGLDDDETGEAEDNPAKILFIPTPPSGDFKLTVFLDETDHYSCDLLAYDNAGGTSKTELKDDNAKPGDTQRFTVTFSGAPGSKVKVASTAK